MVQFLPYLKLKSGRFFVFVFFVFENLVLPAERRGCLKNKPKNNKKTIIFNFRILLFFFVFLFFCWNPYFYSVFSKNAKLKETQKRKKDTICEHNCANSSCQNVRFFSAFFIFAVFPISIFSEMFLTGFQKSKNNKIAKQEEQKNNNNQKTRCKANINEMLWFKTTQDNKQNNKNKRTSWNKKSKHNKKKKQEPERENEKQEGRKKDKNKRETKKEKGKFRGGRPQKRLKRNKGRHWKINKKCPFLGGKTVFFVD